MTNREQATYDLIVKNTKKGLLTTKKEIVENYPITKFGDGYEWIEKPTSHDNCSAVWHDINRINFQKDKMIIISVNGYYWIATKEEAVVYVTSYFNTKIRPALQRYWNLQRKIGMDGMQDIFTEEFIQTLLKEE